jgi:hypothetical protein
MSVPRNIASDGKIMNDSLEMVWKGEVSVPYTIPEIAWIMKTTKNFRMVRVPAEIRTGQLPNAIRGVTDRASPGGYGN